MDRAPAKRPHAGPVISPQTLDSLFKSPQAPSWESQDHEGSYVIEGELSHEEAERIKIHETYRYDPDGPARAFGTKVEVVYVDDEGAAEFGWRLEGGRFETSRSAPPTDVPAKTLRQVLAEHGVSPGSEEATAFLAAHGNPR